MLDGSYQCPLSLYQTWNGRGNMSAVVKPLLKLIETVSSHFLQATDVGLFLLTIQVTC